MPPELTLEVGIEGIPEARFWGDEWPTFSQEIFETYTDVDFRKHFPESTGKLTTTWQSRAAVQTEPLAPDSSWGGRHPVLGPSSPW